MFIQTRERQECQLDLSNDSVLFIIRMDVNTTINIKIYIFCANHEGTLKSVQKNQGRNMLKI